jgi:RNA polymerase primary sigma factor
VNDYLADIGRIPLLTPAEEIELGHQVQRMIALRHQTSLSAADRRTIRTGRRALGRMVQGNLRLVVNVSKHYLNRGIDQLDLIQEGTVGLIRAVEKFDPTRGYKFSTYGYWWIRQAMQRAIDHAARAIRQPIHQADLQRRLRGIVLQQLQATGTEPTLTELAKAAGRTIDQVRLALTIDKHCCSLDTRIRQQDGCELSELLASDRPTPDAILDQQEHIDGMREAIATGMDRLTPVQQQIIIRRFGFHGQEQETLTAIGADMGITRERVRQLEAKALAILRSQTPYDRALLRD